VISKVIDSPIGCLQLVANDHALSELNWPEQHTEGLAQSSKRSKILDQAEEELRRYFEGQLQIFNVPLTPTGSAFQQQVWARLAMIEWGKTCSYKTIACGINKPIFIPCHRVVGSDGSLTGFSGGINLKRLLLAHESDQRNLALA
jgi:methylated-DNA-[protein]-cysteine S-methyltransferase